ncbi:MAG TPA: YicC/YloC family endoribonuclease [Candidatus Binataceae bacterium]|nr:YicC/YloC family endoribonuclease [Candidatus Binataceae bacterium]
MRSMTGFGRAHLERDGVRVVAEIRALNQRFFELKLSLPRGWGEHEAQVRKMVQATVSRGRVEVFLRYSALKAPPVKLQVNEKLARMYVAELRKLGKQLDLNGRLGIETVMQRPEIFHVIEDEDDQVQHGVKVGLEALELALARLETERVREGNSLKRDFTRRIKKILAAMPKIERLSADTRAEVLAAFQNRVKELLAEIPVNEKRLYEEAAGVAQRGDITEELTRLRIHLDALKELLDRAEPVGKSIEFLLQEINREVNTMGSKSQNAGLSQLTVEVKGEAEKMREQVQNVE